MNSNHVINIDSDDEGGPSPATPVVAPEPVVLAPKPVPSIAVTAVLAPVQEVPVVVMAVLSPPAKKQKTAASTIYDSVASVAQGNSPEDALNQVLRIYSLEVRNEQHTAQMELQLAAKLGPNDRASMVCKAIMDNTQARVQHRVDQENARRQAILFPVAL
jgi:hypothetical protein